MTHKLRTSRPNAVTSKAPASTSTIRSRDRSKRSDPGDALVTIDRQNLALVTPAAARRKTSRDFGGRADYVGLEGLPKLVEDGKLRVRQNAAAAGRSFLQRKLYTRGGVTRKNRPDGCEIPGLRATSGRVTDRSVGEIVHNGPASATVNSRGRQSVPEQCRAGARDSVSTTSTCFDTHKGVTLALRRLTGQHRAEASLTVPTRVDRTKRNYLRAVSDDGSSASAF